MVNNPFKHKSPRVVWAEWLLYIQVEGNYIIIIIIRSWKCILTIVVLSTANTNVCFISNSPFKSDQIFRIPDITATILCLNLIALNQQGFSFKMTATNFNLILLWGYLLWQIDRNVHKIKIEDWGQHCVNDDSTLNVFLFISVSTVLQVLSTSNYLKSTRLFQPPNLSCIRHRNLLALSFAS